MVKFLNPDNPAAGVLIETHVDPKTGAFVEASPNATPSFLPPVNDRSEDQSDAAKPVKSLTEEDIKNAERQQAVSNIEEARARAGQSVVPGDAAKSLDAEDAGSLDLDPLLASKSSTKIEGKVPSDVGPEKTKKGGDDDDDEQDGDATGGVPFIPEVETSNDPARAKTTAQRGGEAIENATSATPGKKKTEPTTSRGMLTTHNSDPKHRDDDGD